jgi:hypothetical protein
MPANSNERGVGYTFGVIPNAAQGTGVEFDAEIYRPLIMEHYLEFIGM